MASKRSRRSPWKRGNAQTQTQDLPGYSQDHSKHKNLRGPTRPIRPSVRPRGERKELYYSKELQDKLQE